MKLIFTLLSFLILQTALSQIREVIIKDAFTKELLPGCTISLQGKRLDITGKSGNYKLSPASIPANSLLVINCAGYVPDTVSFSRIQALNNTILLRPSQKLLDEVVVTGVSRPTFTKENPVAIVAVSAKAINKTLENNIIDALVKNAPGLNAVKTGPNISKPFIRGLGYNRVLTLYDGIRQEGQQWGDEHGIEVDAYNIERAEVIKGPASIMYGSDALAGVVSLFPALPNNKSEGFSGRLLSEYQSNNGLIGNGLRLGYVKGNWLFSATGSYRLAKNYSNAVDGAVYNTGFKETNAAFTTSYTTDKGYSRLSLTLYNNLQGIPDGSRDSLTRKFTYQTQEVPVDDITNRPVVPDAALHSYTLSPLHQHIQHYRVYNNNHYAIGNDYIDVSLGFQQNIRREYNHPTQPEQAGLYVRLNTLNYGVRYTTSSLFNTDITLGVNGMYQSNKNKNATDFPIPDYNLLDAGAFLFMKKKIDKLVISGGIRYDTRTLKSNDFYIAPDAGTGFDKQVSLPDTVGATLQFPALHQSFKGISLSLGATYKVNNSLSFKVNAARGYRAPNVTEIASNGLDPGAHIVYIGNRDFVPEFSFQQDIGVELSFSDLSASASIFNNNVQHYIYLDQLTDAQGNPVVIVPGNKTFKYIQGNARLYGFEVSTDLHPKALPGFNWINNISAVYGVNNNKMYKGKGVEGEYLPLIPPLKIFSALQQNIRTKRKTLTDIDLVLEAEYNAAQNRFLALNNTESFTPNYTLINLGTTFKIKTSKTTEMQLQLQMNNLFNIAYQSNLSRLKYFEYYEHSPNNRYGIYSQGRNMCVRLIVPF